MSSATHEPVRRGATPWPRLKFAPMGHCPQPAQTFGRWSRLGAWERLLELAQRRGGVEAGMAGLTASEAVPRTLDGTSVRAHHKAAGAAKKGDRQRSVTRARHWAVRAAVTGPRLA